MPDTVTGFRRVRDRLRARGFAVHEVPHWEGRGAGTLRPAGFLNHHTAGSRSGGNTASLRLVTFGRSDLRNALCNWYCARNGDLYIVAGGVAWHAGRGDLGSNSTLIGCEAENDGLGEPWHPRSLDAQAALNAECAREFGHGARRCWEHKEHAEGRKIDRAGIDGSAWRHRVEHDSTGGGSAPPPPPPPAPGSRTIRQGDKGPDVVAWQRHLSIRDDGDFGPETHAWTVDYQRRHGLTPDGIVGPQTWATYHAAQQPVAPPPPPPPIEEDEDMATIIYVPELRSHYIDRGTGITYLHRREDIESWKAAGAKTVTLSKPSFERMVENTPRQDQLNASLQRIEAALTELAARREPQ
jgi:hypothetical protein